MAAHAQLPTFTSRCPPSWGLAAVPALHPGTRCGRRVLTLAASCQQVFMWPTVSSLDSRAGY